MKCWVKSLKAEPEQTESHKITAAGNAAPCDDRRPSFCMLCRAGKILNYHRCFHHHLSTPRFLIWVLPIPRRYPRNLKDRTLYPNAEMPQTSAYLTVQPVIGNVKTGDKSKHFFSPWLSLLTGNSGVLICTFHCLNGIPFWRQHSMFFT